MRAIGDIDYDDMVLNNIDASVLNSYNELAKPVSNVKYKLLLIRKILENNNDLDIDRAIGLSKELDYFLRDVEKNGLDFDDLDNVVDDEYALHWQKILDFLKNFGRKWQYFLTENNIVSRNTNSLKNIEAYAELFKNKQPPHPIIIAGNFASVKAVMELVKTLAKYNNTYFIFKGLENTLATDEFECVDELHSHFHFKCILKELSINRKDIANIKYEKHKILDDDVLKTLNNAMLPSNLTHRWHTMQATKPTNINYIEFREEYDELNFLTFYLLNYIGKNGLKNIAIITDIEHSHQIELFLKKWNLPLNNSFGKRFLFDNLVQYLFLILNVRNSNFAPEYLLSLLKNDFVREDLRNYVKLFELQVINDKNNKNGLSSYRKNIQSLDDIAVKNSLLDFITKIENYFDVFGRKYFDLEEIVRLHLRIAEEISDHGGNIWFLDENSKKVLEFFQDLMEQSDCIDNINLQNYISLLAFLLSEQSCSENYSTYPAINIISPQEARLINYDLVIVQNMNDGIFPANIATDPYMSRSMRAKFGLPAKEIGVGEFCYDFVQLLAQKEVLLTRATKVNGEATFKSRFLQRLEIFLQCNGLMLNNCTETMKAYEEYMDIKYNNCNDIYKKRPCPIPQEKLNKLSATEVELLVKNPYDIYAKKILRLRRLNIVKKTSVFAKIGNAVHETLEKYCRNYEKYKHNRNYYVRELVREVLEKHFADDKISMEFNFDKILTMLEYFFELDDSARKNGCRVLVEDRISCTREKENFSLVAKVDRFEMLQNNVAIIDYKTGELPSKVSVMSGEKLQMPIEALIMVKNNFNVTSLEHWSIKYGGGEVLSIDDSDKKMQETNITIIDLINKTESFLLQLLKYFNSGSNGYIATSRNMDYSDYNELSRIREWISE
jgi:ATP-dependent helicase/nuclease subunit B